MPEYIKTVKPLSDENLLITYGGITEEECNRLIDSSFQEVFFGQHRVYFENDDGTGYMVDTGNDDVRTEGQSYGMMLALQYGRRDVFDRIWEWTKKYMLQTSGENEGYFAWSCRRDGAKNSEGPAPDGEEYFAMALLFAERRWGEKAYGDAGRTILRHMVHKENFPMFDPETKLIRFVPNAPFTDPSYHLPHFYELFAMYGSPEDAGFFQDAARLSREFLKKACNAETGLNPNQADYSGAPTEWMGNRSYFYSDAYRTAMNIALDAAWLNPDEWAREQSEKLMRFFEANDFDRIYSIEGTPVEPQFREPDAMESGMLHPMAVRATTACGAIASRDKELNRRYIELFLKLTLRTDKRRYYDNLLYLFCLLALTGNYKIY